ncbi:hypothetical protein [uncultured Maribacter sp.]|uniref:hypothetical protein n=1 Tax=uncultured Maribacter sp. TaxID=431308 RepID=UPI002628C6FB|nr:hypothetical protein [uncultured Maribacter sp.]
MIIIVPILLYLTAVIFLIWIVNISFKSKTEKARKTLKRWIIGIAVVVFLPLGLLYFSYLFGLALDNHYDVKKGSFLWYATMDNKAIANFPVFESVGKVKHNSIGGDSPNIGTGWEIEYESTAEIEELSDRITEYLKKEGYELKTADQPEYNWKADIKKNEKNQLYSGSNDKGESLDLLLQKQDNELTKIECSILY